jgi:hypothetical protein
MPKGEADPADLGNVRIHFAAFPVTRWYAL